VTTVTCLFIINKKEKEIQKKRNIKSRKIDKRKRKILILTHIITVRGLECRKADKWMSTDVRENYGTWIS